MAKRRKRRSAAKLDGKVLAEIRKLHREHLKEISAVLSNALGFAVTVRPVKAPEVLQIPREVRGKARKGKATRRQAHIAGWHSDPPAAYPDADKELECSSTGDMPSDEVGL